MVHGAGLGALVALVDVEAAEPNRHRHCRSQAPWPTGRGRLGGAHAEVGLCSKSPERLGVGRIDAVGANDSMTLGGSMDHGGTITR